MSALTVWVIAGWTVFGLPDPTPPPARTDAVTVRLVRPQEQGERFLALFQGARAPHPAAALAAWKNANRGRVGLGKGTEALVAALNPAMLTREARLLDEAELHLAFDPATGHPRWRARVPQDDGSLAAWVTSLALTDGAGLD